MPKGFAIWQKAASGVSSERLPFAASIRRYPEPARFPHQEPQVPDPDVPAQRRPVDGLAGWLSAAAPSADSTVVT